MESTVRELPEIVEETIDQDGQEGTEIQYSSWDMVEYAWDDEHHSKSMRACLQFCYLFPQDYEFQKNDLTQLWIAEELLSVAQNETPAYSELVDRSSRYFEEFEKMNIFLLSSLDHSKHLQRYKLNKSVFHLLQQHHDDAYSRVDDTNSYFSDNTLHSSIYDSSIDAITLEKLYHAKRLCTLLMLHESGSKLDHVPREVFLKLPWISVLDLSGTNIKEVPSSIGKLKNLRYLNLSGTPIARLPESVCSLHQMRILKLRGCLKLVSLPKGMRRLVKLQYLDVDVARLLVSMPPGFGDLTDLDHLPAFVVGKENGCYITELKKMVNLRGTLRILRLENVSNSKEAADAALNRKKHVVKLQLQWTEFQDRIQFKVLHYLQPHIQIEELQIVGFAGLEFPSWIGDPRFSKLVKVSLHDCRKCKVLPPLGKLPFLKHLFISDMHAVKEIDGLFCGRYSDRGKGKVTHSAFPSLENLTLNGMPALEKWIGIGIYCFHHLQKLSITCCHKLTSLPELSLLVSLQQLEISLCASLKSLPNKGLPTSLQCLSIMDCPLLKEWCLEESKLERGKLAGIPNIWIDDLQISLDTRGSSSSRLLNDDVGVRFGQTTILSDSCSFSSSNEDEDDSSSTTTDPMSIISRSARFKCNIKSWRRGSLLGSGSFGTVYEGLSDDGFFFAVKEVSLLDQGSQGKQSIIQLEQEISLLSQFEHENIVQYLGTDKDEEKLYIFLELVTKGSLAQLYQKYLLQDSQVSAYTRQILQGLTYLHDRNVVHRDIRCGNILVDANGSVKLADFGLAKATKFNDVKSCEGTAFWMAPEVVNRKGSGYGLAADIWSLGCTVLEMLTRKLPYAHLEGVQALFRIGKGEPPPIPSSLSKPARDFIHRCLKVKADERPTAAQLLDDPFVKISLSSSSGSASPAHPNWRRGYTPEEGEARGLLQALLWARALDYRDIMLESDCKSIVDYLQGKTCNISRTSKSILDDVKELYPSFDYVLVSHVSRVCNIIAHVLAREASKTTNVSWIGEAPNHVRHLLHQEAAFCILTTSD